MRHADQMLIDMLAPSHADLRSLADQHNDLERQVAFMQSRAVSYEQEQELAGLVARRDRVWARIDDILSRYRSR